MKQLKRIGYKLIVVLSIVMTFCCFVASTPVEASKVKTNDFYYSGTMKGSYTVNKSFLEKLIDSLGAILDYLLGLMTMGFRIVFVGWTALMERCLTWFVEGATGEDVVIEDSLSSTSLDGSSNWITLEAIFFNRVPLLNPNVFELEPKTEYDATGSAIDPTGATEAQPIDENSFVVILKKAIASWYYILRTIAIMVMLVILIYIGVKLAIQSSASQKALYKRVLVDWVVGMILVFSMHYIMIFIIDFNDMLVQEISKLNIGTKAQEVYEYGLEERATETISNEDLEVDLYDEVKTRAYDAKLTVGTVGMIMYMVLVYYAWKYTILYLRRYLTIAVLVIMAPIVSVTYAFNKVNSGKSVIFSKWLKEFAFIVLLQSIHALIYVMFVDTALALSLSSISAIMLVFVLLNFMSSAEKVFRKIFNVHGNLTDDIAKPKGIKESLDTVKALAVIPGVSKVAKGYTKGVAGVMTKPIRAAGAAGFAGAVKSRMNRLDAKAKQEGYKSYDEMKTAENHKRMDTIRRGSIAKALKTGEIDLTKIQNTVNSLKIGDRILDDRGQAIAVVDEDYIRTERDALAEIEDINNDPNKDKYISDLEQMQTVRARAKDYIGRKWDEILNPQDYLKKEKRFHLKAKEVEKKDANGETVKDENGNVVMEKTHYYDDGKYHAKRPEKEYGNYKYIGKTTSSIGLTLKKKLKFENLANLDDKDKAALAVQLDLIKNQVTGFAGIFVGLPLLVAEPQLGMAAMAVGISGTSKAYSGRGRRNRHVAKNIKLNKSTGKYKFVGFDGRSMQTIAEGAMIEAREQVGEIANGKVEHEARVRRTVRKHTKLYENMKKVVKFTAKGAATVVPLAALETTVGLPVTGTVAGVAAGTILTGHILNNFGSNAYMAYRNTMRTAAARNAKAYENASKREMSYLDSLAEKYFDMQDDLNEQQTEKLYEQFAATYMLIKEHNEREIDEMTDEEVAAELGFSEEIETEFTPDGKIKLAASSENSIIDNAIIEIAQKSGIMDISNLEMSKVNLNAVEKIITNKLVNQGIVDRNGNASQIIQDLEKKIKDRKALLDAEGSAPVEQKIADDSIRQVMQQQGISNPEEVNVDDVEVVINQKYNEMAGVIATKETSSVINKMGDIRSQMTEGDIPVVNNQNVPISDGTKQVVQSESTQVNSNVRMGEVVNPDIIDRTVSSVQSRKTALAQKSQEKIKPEVSQAMREALKEKRLVELNATVLQKQDELEAEMPRTETSVDMMSADTNINTDVNENINTGLDVNQDMNVNTNTSYARFETSSTQPKTTQTREESRARRSRSNSTYGGLDTGARPESSYDRKEAASAISEAINNKVGAMSAGSDSVYNVPGAIPTRPESIYDRAGTIPTRPESIYDRPGAMPTRPESIYDRPGAMSAMSESIYDRQSTMSTGLDTIYDRQGNSASSKEKGATGMRGAVADFAVNMGGGLNSSQDGSSSVGGASNTDNVLKMLQLQTQMYSKKKELVSVSASRSQMSKAQKRLEYRTELFSGANGSINKNVLRGATSKKSADKKLSNMQMDDLLRKLSSNQNL